MVQARSLSASASLMVLCILLLPLLQYTQAYDEVFNLALLDGFESLLREQLSEFDNKFTQIKLMQDNLLSEVRDMSKNISMEFEHLKKRVDCFEDSFKLTNMSTNSPEVKTDFETCPEGTFRMRGLLKCFKIFNDTWTWEQSQAMCQQQKGMRPATNIDAIALELRQYVLDTYGVNRHVWLNAKPEVEGGNYIWQHDQSVLEPDNSLWGSREPDGGGRLDHCLYLALFQDYITDTPYGAERCYLTGYLTLCEMTKE